MSRRFTLNSHDWQKIAQGALIAAGGAAIVFIADAVLPILRDSTKAGDLALYVAASAAVNALRKWLTGRPESVEPSG